MTILSQQEWYDKLKNKLSDNWSSHQIACNYGHYKAQVTKGIWSEDTLWVSGANEYKIDGRTELFEAKKINVNTDIVNNYELMEPKPIECMHTFVAKKFLQLKASAEGRGKEFDLTLVDVKKLLQRKTCYYTGMKLGIYEDHKHPNQLTIDRKDPTKGYVKGNVQFICYSVNLAKQTFSHNQMLEFFKSV